MDYWYRLVSQPLLVSATVFLVVSAIKIIIETSSKASMECTSSLHFSNMLSFGNFIGEDQMDDHSGLFYR
jgi:hypothetical protein